MPEFPEDMCTYERVAVALWLLADGWTPTTREAATRLGVSKQGAGHLLHKLGNIVPVRRDELDGCWRLYDALEDDPTVAENEK